MNANDLTSIDQVCAFMSGTQRVVFEVAGDKQGRYDWVRRTLVKFDYSGCGKADRGVLISYLMKVSSYSRAQVKRLIKPLPGDRTADAAAAHGTGIYPALRISQQSCH